MTNSIFFPTTSPSWPSRLSRLMLLVFLASLLPLQMLLGAEHHDLKSGTKFSGKQGEVLWIEVPVSHPQASVSGALFKRNIPFFQIADGKFAAIVGLDMQDPPGSHELTITIQSTDITEHLSYSIEIVKEKYSVQHLKLPKNKVDLDAKTLKRVRLEQQEMADAFHHIGTHPLWNGPFLEPTKGTITGRFGSRRVINGQHKRPHSGEDIAAPQGTPVLAINTGTVVAAVDHFFSGKGVIIDHGVGLFSMYFHLSEIDVQPGQTLKKGEALGKVGATGRATGPHLHWGVRLNGARVNPYALTALPLEN
ncbi:MAG: M23 family metallopeptidase [Nitrospirota bacterium]|nr:M23 family metallopeptidase [Nitrospirota bacterium]